MGEDGEAERLRKEVPIRYLKTLSFRQRRNNQISAKIIISSLAKWHQRNTQVSANRKIVSWSAKKQSNICKQKDYYLVVKETIKYLQTKRLLLGQQRNNQVSANRNIIIWSVTKWGQNLLFGHISSFF